MKKLALSIALMSVIIVGGSVATFAAETNEDTTVNEANITTDESKTYGNPNCPYYSEENKGLGNVDCPYYEEVNNENNEGLGQGKRYGYNSENKGNGNCNRTGQRIMRNRKATNE